MDAFSNYEAPSAAVSLYSYRPESAAVSLYSYRPESEFYKTISRRTSSVAETLQEFHDLESTTGEVVTRFELDIACICEKLANFNLLLMHVETMESEFDGSDTDPNSSDLVLKALEFDFLSGFLNSEVRVLETHISDLLMDKTTMQEFLSSCKYMGEPSTDMEDMLCDSQKSLQQSLEQVSEIKLRAAMFERNLMRFAEEETSTKKNYAQISQNNELPELKDKMKMQTMEHQRHILRMLEKSLERELDLEKRFTESTQIEEALTMRLNSSEQEVLYAEEETEMTLEKLYEADHTSVVLMGISKELLTKMNTLQFDLKDSSFKETTEKSRSAKKANMEMEKTIKDLKDRIVKAERRAENAEAKCKLLTETKNEKVGLLEKKLKDTKIKLKYSKTRKGSLDEIEESTVVMMVGVADDYYSYPRFS